MVRQNMMPRATDTVPATHDIQIRVFCINAECKLRSSICRVNEFGSKTPENVCYVTFRNNQADIYTSLICDTALDVPATERFC
jgi:hypothetical protein